MVCIYLLMLLTCSSRGAEIVSIEPESNLLFLAVPFIHWQFLCCWQGAAHLQLINASLACPCPSSPSLSSAGVQVLLAQLCTCDCPGHSSLPSGLFQAHLPGWQLWLQRGRGSLVSLLGQRRCCPSAPPPQSARCYSSLPALSDRCLHSTGPSHFLCFAHCNSSAN